MKPYIVCCGESGRCVVYGMTDTCPEEGQDCILHDARMILSWSGKSGLFGVAAKGPDPQSRITAAVERTSTGIVKQWLSVSSKAARAMSEHPNAV